MNKKHLLSIIGLDLFIILVISYYLEDNLIFKNISYSIYIMMQNNKLKTVSLGFPQIFLSTLLSLMTVYVINYWYFKVIKKNINSFISNKNKRFLKIADFFIFLLTFIGISFIADKILVSLWNFYFHSNMIRIPYSSTINLIVSLILTMIVTPSIITVINIYINNLLCKIRKSKKMKGRMI